MGKMLLKRDKTADPEKALGRIAVLMALLSFISMFTAGIIHIFSVFVIPLLLMRKFIVSRISERMLTAVSNVLAFGFLSLFVMIHRGTDLLEGFITVLPYLLLVIQIYYMMRPTLVDRFYYYSLAVLLTLVQAAVVQPYSLFILLFVLQIYFMLKGGKLSETVHVRTALAAGKNIRNPYLFGSMFSMFRKPAETKTVYSGSPQIIAGALRSKPARTAVFLLLITMVAVLFVSVPRPGRSGTLTQFSPRGADTEAGRRVGFTSEVVHGRFSQLAQDDTVVMTVGVDPENKLPESEIKWRGKALNSFDGISWKSEYTSRRWTQTVFDGRSSWRSSRDYVQMERRYLERNYVLDPEYIAWDSRADLVPFHVRVILKGAGVVFLPPSPKVVSSSFRGSYFLRDFNDSYILRNPYPTKDELAYTVYSAPFDAERNIRLRKTDFVTERKYPGVTQMYLKLPADLDPRILQLGKTITSGLKPYEAAAAIKEYLENTCTYSLDPETTPAGTDPLADFLFDAKTGHCEYFASAMCVLLRTAGIPSRMIAGFQRGEYNGYGDFYTVRQRDAHAWVEAFFGEEGWAVFDPSPRAIENRTFRESMGWFSSGVMPVIQYLDAKYYEYVLDYDRGTQNNLFEKASGLLKKLLSPVTGAYSWFTMHPFLFSILILTVSGWFGFRIFRGFRKKRISLPGITAVGVGEYPEVRWGEHGKAVAEVYFKCRKLVCEVRDIETAPSETARDFLKTFTGTRPDEKSREYFSELTLMYEKSRFALEDFTKDELLKARETAAEFRKLSSQIRV